MSQRTITVHGMSCGGCEQSVESAIEELDGVTEAEADRETDSVAIVGDADDDAITAAVEDAGFEAAV